MPYLGILFCPVVVIAGGFGVLTAQRAPGRGGKTLAVCCIFVGLLLAGAHYILWWAF